MTTELLKETLLWCLLMNYGLLLLWAGLLTLAHDWLYRLHGRWFDVSADAFNTIHYAGMAFYKLAIILFNLTPLIALWIVA